MATFDDYIDRLKQKDNDAFEYIYEQTKRGVYAIIVSIIHDRQMTEDLMQETYIKMLKNIHQYQKGRNFNAWVTQIAKNLAYDYLRETKHSMLVDPIEQSHIINQTSDEKSQEDLTLDELIAPLDEEERQIVLLHIVSYTKFKDISSIVDKPLGTVLWMYQRALKKIKNGLGKENL